MIPWVLLAPVISGGFSVGKVLTVYRQWRAGEATLTELLEEIGVAGVMTGVAAGTMLHPLLAGAYIVTMGSIEAHELWQARRYRLEQLKDPASIEAPEED